MAVEKSEDKHQKYSFERLLQNSLHYRSEQKRNTLEECRKFIRKNFLLISTLIGVTAGVVLGLSLRNYNLGECEIALISYPGELFMRVLKMMMLPLATSSLITGTSNLNAKMNGKIAIRALVYFASTTVLNATYGVCLAMVFHPGNPGIKSTTGDVEKQSENHMTVFDSLLDLGRNMFPENLFQAMFQQAYTVYVEKENIIGNNLTEFNHTSDFKHELRYRSGTNMLGIVFFCLAFGSVLGTMGESGKPVANFFSVTFHTVMKIVRGIIKLTPIGVCSVIVGKILNVEDIGVIMSQLGLFIITFIIGIVTYQLIIMQLIYFVIVRKNPYKFYYNNLEAMLTAGSTGSTAATLPITFRCMEEKNKIDPRITRFILPIGCNLNTDGSVLYMGIASVFIAQMNNMDISIGLLCNIIFTSTIASCTGASVPSATLVMLLIVLSSIDAPIDDITLLFAVDWLLDRLRTTNNMLGDCYTAAVVEHLSKDELAKSDAIEMKIENEHCDALHEINLQLKTESC